MTALAEALLAAQRQATAALSKSYLAGPGDDDAREALTEALDAIGCGDKTEQGYAYAVERGGEMFFERCYGIRYTRGGEA